MHVDVGLPHLDRLFDYAVPEALDHAAVPGSRVRVRFSGRLVDGYVVERVAESELARLAPLSKSLSDEVVLPVETIELVRAVADHYAGTFSDVVRLAVPPRHAATEKAEVKPLPESGAPDVSPGPLAAYPDGAGYVSALASGGDLLGRRGRSYRWQLRSATGPRASLRRPPRAWHRGGRPSSSSLTSRMWPDCCPLSSVAWAEVWSCGSRRTSVRQHATGCSCVV